jgi:AraC family transcriptional regulator of adaptative response/methylated-DNA-[protein]-cysteine methyltransferase
MTFPGDTRQRDTLPTEMDPRWSSIVARDAAADGTFYYSVATTGVYCVPSCSARLARPETVRFHSTRQQAEEAGFRPCKRCTPDQREPKRQWVPDEIRFAIGSFSLGLVLVAQSSRGVCAVLLGDDGDELRRDLASRFPGAPLLDDAAGLETLTAKVVEFVESPAHGLDVPLDMRGSEFQRRVWHALRQIPAGSTASYSDVAHRMGMPGSARAVARACATNPLAVVVPCHRVLTSDGKLSGYRWGVQRKRALLEREARS